MSSISTIFSFRRILMLATAATAVVAVPASAQIANSAMGVGATVTSNCTLATTAIAFGNVDVTTGAAVDGTGSMGITCTSGTAWTAVADAGTAAGATVAARQMTSGANTLNYALYTDNTRAALWGDGTTGTATIAGVGTGALVTSAITASVLPTQTGAPAGVYADQVNVTITY
jgi:spore coat protein U-like protein